jgi:hypothetical protein
MIHMGPAFRTPRKDDLNQWRKVEKMRRAGFIFHGSGRAGVMVRELLPRKDKDVEAFLLEAGRAKNRWLTGERSAAVPMEPPVVRFLYSRSRAPYAQRTFKKLRLGEGGDVEAKFPLREGAWIELRWKSGVGVFMTGGSLPSQLIVNGKRGLRLPKQLHPGDWISVGSYGAVILEW